MEGAAGVAEGGGVMNTETLDKLYLEWSQFTQARTARELQYEALLKRAAAACRMVPVGVRNGEHISLPRQIELALMKGETLASVTECRHIFDDDRCVKCGGVA